jgi:N-acetylmuramoyl-L-alanine amidase
MLEYYAFNAGRFKHAVNHKTPAILVEMGYLSNAEDLAFIEDPVNPAYALKIGILSYLREVGRIE